MTTAPPIPVFVLGLQRSGTTLAANLLAAQPGIAAVTAAHHRGVHESVFFSHFVPAMTPWPGGGDGERAAMAAPFLASDYFRLTGLEQSWGQAAAEASRSPADLFRKVMEALAARAAARAWVEKSPHHTLMAREIAAALPQALFLCVTRQTAGFVRSRLWSYGRQPPSYPRRALLIARACASTVFHRRCMAQLPARLGAERVFSVTYGALRDDPGAALAPLLAALGLPADDVQASEFAPNSSFSSRAARDRGLTLADRAIARAAEAAAAALPQALLVRLQRYLARRRVREFPHWVWPQTPQDRQAAGTVQTGRAANSNAPRANPKEGQT